MSLESQVTGGNVKTDHPF